jgi:hypothetical protein
MLKNTMDHTGTPAKFWLICLLLFLIPLCNVLVNSKGLVPLSVMTGQVTDVSAYLQFHWWQEVFFEQPDKSEGLGRWVGVAQDKGDALTYYILTHDTQQVVVRSNVRHAKDPLFPNRSLRPDDGSGSLTAGGEASSIPVLMALSDIDPAALDLPKYSPEELLGLTFLRETEDGDKIRAKIVRKIMDKDALNHQNIKFLVSIGDDAYEEIIAYNELSDIVQQQHEAEASGELDTWTFTEILDHQGPLSTSHPNYKGSNYNVKVKWSDASETWEPIAMVFADDPVTLSAYAKDHNLLDTPGWKRCKRLARRAKVLQRMLNQSRRRAKASAVRYKFGVQIPRTAKEAYKLDEQNGNTLWADAIAIGSQVSLASDHLTLTL